MAYLWGISLRKDLRERIKAVLNIWFLRQILPKTKNPKTNRKIFIMVTIFDGEIFPKTLDKTIAIPLAPPVEKLFENSKKYTPPATNMVPNVIIK